MPALTFRPVTDDTDGAIRGVHYYEIKKEADRDWSVKYGIDTDRAGLAPDMAAIARVDSKREAKARAEAHLLEVE